MVEFSAAEEGNIHGDVVGDHSMIHPSSGNP
jgi:hypothetical protein